MTEFAIKEKPCLKHKLSLEEFLVALSVRQIKDLQAVIDNLLAREVLVKKEGKYYVTQHWSDVIDEIICDSAPSEEMPEEQLTELAKQMQAIYPAGKMLNKFGIETPYYYRCNVGEIRKRLKKFFLLSGNYTSEEILDATRRYVESFHGNYRGMRLIKYFILKDDIKETVEGNHIEQISDLATFLENKAEEDYNWNGREEELVN